MRAKPMVFYGEDALALELWHDLAAGDRRCRLSQTPQWARWSADELGWKIGCMMWELEEVVFPFVVVNRHSCIDVLVESLPWGQIGGPLVGGSEHREVTSLVAKEIEGLAQELLVYADSVRFSPATWQSCTYSIHEASLTDDRERQWALAEPRCRTAARHAEREGVRIVKATGGALLAESVALHLRQQGVRDARVLPGSWWERLLREGAHHVGLWCAVMDSRVIAALLVGWWQDRAVALISTSDPRARPLKAGNLLYLTVLEELGVRGLRTLDLGGSRGKPGLESFKESVGAYRTSRPFYRYRNPTYKLYQSVARKAKMIVGH